MKSPDFEILPVENYQKYIDKCVRLALQSKCSRRRCGSVVINVAYKPMQVIGEGWNSMPCNVDGECFKDSLPDNFKSDKTCCIHAEQRAIMEALGYPAMVKNSLLLFVSIDENGKPINSGEPYCTICSKMALDAGVGRFILYHEDGLRSYDTKYYNELSFKYQYQQEHTPHG